MGNHSIRERSRPMLPATKSPPALFFSSIDEARALVRQCAEPCPAGDLVKIAIFRASRRLEMPVSRVKDLWYGDARRIDAHEMDQLRRSANEAELAQTVAAIEFLKEKLSASPSSAPYQAIATVQAALLACHRDTFGHLTGEAIDGGLR
jgi:hypothetical protein